MIAEATRHPQTFLQYEIRRDGQFDYVETKPGHSETLVLLHGLFGAMSNFKCILEDFAEKINVVIPLLPIYGLPTPKVNVIGLTEYVSAFIAMKKFGPVHILGNSAGGHVGLLYALDNPKQVRSITLTGSSGLFESVLGSTFPRRGDYDYVRDVSVKVFYDTSLATKEMVDEVFSAVNDPARAICVLRIAKSALRHNLADRLHRITAPVLLVWGRNDTITPPFVAEQFDALIPDTRLHWIDKCGHAPMMERPDEFNAALRAFLHELDVLDPA